MAASYWPRTGTRAFREASMVPTRVLSARVSRSKLSARTARSKVGTDSTLGAGDAQAPEARQRVMALENFILVVCGLKEAD